MYTTNQLEVLAVALLAVALLESKVTLQPIYHSHTSYQVARVPVPLVLVVLGALGVLFLD